LIERKISTVILPKIELWLVPVQIGRKGDHSGRHVRFGSKADIGDSSNQCPLYPQKRTLIDGIEKPALCIGDNARSEGHLLFNYLSGTSEQRNLRRTTSGSLAMLTAMRRASSRRVSRDQTAVLSQKRLERLTLGIPLWINTAVLSYFLADPLE
jgi:hypothetical protein